MLTSTARTFIQEGVTTEYATKVLGTTLDNGRLYAQLLTKSSRVLYDHENSPNPTKSYYSQQNDIVPDSDEGSDWPHNRNDYDSPVTFIKNTDYISPNQPINAFLVYPTARQSQASQDSEAVDYRRDEKKEIVMADHIRAEALVDQRPENVLDSVQNVKESFSVSRSSSQSNQPNDIKIKVDKVQPANNLPTYTIKNEFAPSGFSWEDPEYDVQTEKQFLTTPDKRNGKMLYQVGLPKEDMKNLPTVTYYGFADFTTIVGDTVIVFSPQTASPVNVGQITSIKGDATLHNDPTVVVSTVKTFLSHEPDMVTETIKGHTINMETALPTMIVEPVTPYRRSKGEDDEIDNEAATTPLSSTDTNEVTTMSEEMLEEMMEKEIEEATQRVHTISPNMIQPSEITSSSVTLSKPSNEDIAKVLASLASVKAAQEHQATEPLETQFVASETKVSGGVTTIFFEDDPFDQFFQTSQSSEEPIQQTQSFAIDVPMKTVDSATENIVEVTTMETDLTTTEESVAEVTSDSDSDEADTTTVVPIVNDKDDETKASAESKSEAPVCTEDSILSSSTHLKTLTYLTTFFIPLEDTTTTSIQAREVISTEVNYACIAPSTVALEPIITTAVIDTPEVKKEPTTVPINNAEKEEETTEAVMQISTEASVTEATSKAIETNDKKHAANNEDDGEGDEIELIYKTLYTTYTYLTTFFHESTSSISSRKEVVTNIVTSTLDMGQLSSGDALSDLVAQMGGKDAIQPTSVGIGRPTTSFQPTENNLPGIDAIFLEDNRNLHATPALDTQNLDSSDIKTYYTTYTYFTTIFVDGETEISSRTEVYTNYVGNSIAPTSMSDIIKESSSSIVYDDSDDVENNILEHTSPVKSYDNTIRRNPSGQVITSEDSTETSTESEDDENNVIQPSYITMVRNGEASSVDDNTDTPITMVTDVKSSSSDGDRQIIENVNRQWNGLLEDQISSESNTEEIIPSPTLLLQTSYTTFTYFTTMYIGKSSSNILSRLETVTNVVTETLQPSRAVQVEEASLPITYFTTFTYWTTLYKDGSVTTTSREETVSNVISPSAGIEATKVVEPIQATAIPTVNSIPLDNDEDAPPAQVITTTPSSSPATVNVSEPTTYYTTYTYFTTLYVGDDTVLNSRFETVTNVVEPTVIPTGRAINLDNTNNIIPADEKIEKTRLFAPAFVPAAVNEPITHTPTAAVVNSEPTGIISLNQGKIIDAEGISTIFYTTKAVGSNINGLYAQVIESTSSVKVDEAKKAAQTASTPELPGSRVHKTGLVRLIEGTIVSNRTTTLYESKVIGTIIDGRYAQVIESTSSFLIEKTLEPTGVLPNSIQPTVSSTLPIKSTNIISPTSSVVQGSISENGGEDETTEEGYEDDEEGDEDDEEDDGTGKKSRLTFKTRKRTFTPVIRPFASRNRPTFAPKRKNLSPSSATIITRSDFTPTITATPAIKSESSRGRFTSNKRQSSSISVPNSSVASSSSSRRFSRPSRTSSVGNALPSSTLPRSRSSASSRIQPTSSSLPGSSTRRPNIFRASSPIARPSILPSNSRFRINPTQSSSFNRGGLSSSSVTTTPRPSDVEESDEDNLTTNVTNFPTDTTGDDEIQTTTENTRRNQNPLLRFRRPLSSGRAQSINTSGTTSRPVTITTRRSPLLGRGRTTSTTSTTTTTPKPKPRSFQRPSFTPQAPQTLPGTRTRPGSNLFPPRNKFRPATINQDLEKGDESTDNQLSDESRDINDLTNDADIVKEDSVDDSNTRDTRENKKYTVGFRKRVKRQVDYGSRTNTYSSRYRRPTPISRSLVDDIEEQEIQTTRPKVTTIGRFTPNDRTPRLNGNSNGNSVNKNSQSNNRIRPTTSSSQSGRAQFTLREKDNLSSRSNFRRGNTNSNSYSSTNRRKPSTTASSRPKSPRLRNYSGIVTESPFNSRNTNSRSRSSRGRTTSRTRSRNGQDNLDYAIQPSFDGTITVTHHVPTEITIPVVNGKVTEYKNILTAKVSTEVLGPQQYSTSIGSNGKNVIVLNNEITAIGSHGATEITQFFLQETPTTSVIFTPTTIRGRKTSFSHVVPSTVYNVEEVISTIQPQIAANAPLANILLSQLLLGNLGIPQQQQINPLLGVPQQMIQQGPAVPHTEFKVRTTTYVTTVTNAMSTVIPLTFRGKEILTTIVDNSVDVITATEFLTDTIVSTPTVVQQPQQINSLFLNQLLLQQQQQQSQPQQLLQPLTNDAIAQNLFQDGIKVDNDDSTQSNKLYSADVDDNGREYDDYPEQDQLDNVPTVNKVNTQRKSSRKYNNNRAQISQSPLESSVITLYVSGRRPGEFSTVLSTVITTPDSSLQKRAVAEYEEVKPSVSINDIDLYDAEGSDIEQFILPATDIRIESSIDDNRAETESLESIIGDVSKYINMNGDISKMGITTTTVKAQQPLENTAFLA